MTWTRLPDNFTDQPKMLALSRSARLLHIEALVWCNRHTTDGVLPANAVGRITDSPDLDRDVAELVQAGLWERLDVNTWQVCWDQQEKAEKVEQRREAHRQAQARWEKRKDERQARHRIGDHSMCDQRFCAEKRAEMSGEISGETSPDTLPSRPVPTRPAPTGREGRGRGAGIASATAAATRPQRTSSGWLASLDATDLAALPWEVGDECPHDEHGHRWTGKGVACHLCDDVARGTGHPGDKNSAASLAKPRPDWAKCPAPIEVWQQVHAKDARGVTLAFDLASVLVRNAGPSQPTPEDVIDLAGVIYDRIKPRRLDAVWADHQQKEMQQ